MARVIGGITTSHIPAIWIAIVNELQEDPYWKPFFDGYPPVRQWLSARKPDVAVVFYNDHGLNFFVDNMPTFAVGAAFEYHNADEGWGLKPMPAFEGDPELSWHVINSLVEDEFDITTCQEMLVDHGFAIPMTLLWPGHSWSGVKVIPICINTVQHPYPTPARCYRFGQAVGRAIESCDKDLDVVVIGTGGMSHQLDGARAGFINKEFDLMCMEKIVNEPEELLHYTIRELVRLAGTQGPEFIQWLAMRGALGTHPVKKLHSNYHIPISNTGAGLLLLETTAA